VVISGHTHLPKIEIKDDVLFLNPGSAGPRRSDYPVSVAMLRIRNHIAEAEIIRLDP
jgi:predicted phosphodiesterase